MEVVDIRRRILPTSINPFGSFFSFTQTKLQKQTFSDKIYMTWLAFVVSAFLYNAFGIPLRSSYPYQTEENVYYWMACDYFCDLLYLIDVIVVKPRLIFMRNGITIVNTDVWIDLMMTWLCVFRNPEKKCSETICIVVFFNWTVSRCCHSMFFIWLVDRWRRGVYLDF